MFDEWMPPYLNENGIAVFSENEAASFLYKQKQTQSHHDHSHNQS